MTAISQNWTKMAPRTPVVALRNEWVSSVHPLVSSALGFLQEFNTVKIGCLGFKSHLGHAGIFFSSSSSSLRVAFVGGFAVI